MSTNLPFAQSPADPGLKDVLDQLRKSIFLALSCHHIGTVDSFDEAEQTATVTINYKKTYYRLNPATGVYAPTLVDYPILARCPVICLGGGAAALTMPIKKGDECLILFNDRDLDNWFRGGMGAAVATSRLHSFADAIVLVGLRSLANVLSDYDTARAVLRNADSFFAVGATSFEMTNGDQSLGPILQRLLTELSKLTTALNTLTAAMATATPVTVIAQIATPSGIAQPLIQAVGTALTGIKTDLGELIE